MASTNPETPTVTGSVGAGAGTARSENPRPSVRAASKSGSSGGAGKKSGSGGSARSGKSDKSDNGLSTRGKVAAATAAAAGVAAATAAGLAAVKAIRRKRADARVYHVEPKGEDWQVRKEGNERASSVHATKKEAISVGRATAQKNEPSRLVIHGGDGSVQRDHAYGEES